MTGESVQEPTGTPEDELLLRETEKIVVAIGRMFPGLCEVVLHDLRNPDQSIRAIESNLSGREVGQPTTELGLARIQDPGFPDIVQNYANRFPDGRPAKSTSIGIKNGAGQYVAAICLNLDVSLFGSVARSLNNLVRTDEQQQPLTETLRARTAAELRTVIEEFAAARGQTPRSLGTPAKKELARTLRASGYLQVKHSVQVVTELLGVSRATVYNYLRSSDAGDHP
ncbi:MULTISPECIES: helix-turn-helix transcriptional regulator [Streptomyces]|uniref:PAS domain-containing protein n=3 Tax=Streptomyces TaxID=1883 RepID=A0ABD5JK77_9ACTN|nr:MULTISPECIES: PAS domain-containing protein [Streptomyces]MEE4588048.1 PAS domain-containing protein [Streptomyces sp. DSM 41602]AJZ85393.1 PAS domain-containing protein [Streptomyces sp. AgN23]KUL64802.1 DNA-binding protein [Streptomyces violaceusniger]RSS46791.1 transcriptional regulator [Streptomyces sp. WAC05858]WTA81234.1 PAS domain-containing protein [Streptomyces antimycoticus]